MSTPHNPLNAASDNNSPGETSTGGATPARPTAAVPPWDRSPGARNTDVRSMGDGSAVENRQPFRDLDEPTDSPTAAIDRGDLPGEELPDLDAVTHPRVEVSDSENSAFDSQEANTPPRVHAKAAPEKSSARKMMTLGGSGSTGGRPAGRPAGLRAAVQIRHIDPWTTLKLSFVVSVALFFIWMITVAVLYLLLDGMGVWDRLNSSFSDLVNDQGGAAIITPGQIFMYSAGIGLLDLILLTALSTIGAFIYNLCADIVGGVEVTLADRD